MVRETGRQNASGEVGDREGNGRQELESRGINFFCPGEAADKRSASAGVIQKQGIGVKAHHLNAKPFIDMLHGLHDRLQLVDEKHSRRFFNVTKRRIPVRHCPHQLRWYTMGSKDIVAGTPLDVKEFVLRGDLLERQYLHTILAATWRVQKDIAERPLATGFRECFLDGFHAFSVCLGGTNIDNAPGM